MARKLSPDLPPDAPEVVEVRIGELEKKLDRLRTSYESYFMGIEKMPPHTLRREMNRLVLEMQQIQIRKQALRFRFQQLMQKWSLYITYWNRTMREIESGTYRRDIARAQRHLADRGEDLTEEQAIAMGIPSTRAKAFIAQHNRRLAMLRKRGEIKGPAPIDEATTSPDPAPAGAAAAPATAAPRAAAAGATPARATGAARANEAADEWASSPGTAPDAVAPGREVIPGMTHADVEVLHRRYEDARRTTGDGKAYALDQFAAMLQKQAPKIMQQHMAYGVQFDVAVKDGKLVLRAKPLK